MSTQLPPEGISQSAWDEAEAAQAAFNRVATASVKNAIHRQRRKLKDRVIALHRAHPDWNSSEIATALNCLPSYVRATFQRNGLKLHRETTKRERIIAAERERCALIAQNWQPPKQPMTEPTKLYRPFEVADAIAAAIRQGSQPSNVIPVRGTVLAK